VPDHLRGDVAPSLEVRPQFPWELRDWTIHPWQFIVTAAAVAGQFSYIEVQPSDIFDIIVTDIYPYTVNVSVLIHNTTQGAATTNPVPLELDSYWAGTGAAGIYGTARCPGLFARTGAVAALAGQQVDGLLAANLRNNQRYILRAGATPNLIVAGTAVNTAVAATLAGFALPRFVGL
jgi:hypothetical protein